jgi:hypothetical protein
MEKIKVFRPLLGILLAILIVAGGLYFAQQVVLFDADSNAAILTTAARKSAERVGQANGGLTGYRLDRDKTPEQVRDDEIRYGAVESWEISSLTRLRLGPLLTAANGIKYPSVVSNRIMAETGGSPAKLATYLDVE